MQGQLTGSLWMYVQLRPRETCNECAQQDHRSYSRYDVALIAWFERHAIDALTPNFRHHNRSMPAVCRECEGIVANSSDQSYLASYVHTHQKSSWGSPAGTGWLSWHKGSKTPPLHEIKVELLESVNMTLSRGCGFKVSNCYLLAWSCQFYMKFL